jgi:hypothetical protein
MLALLVGTPASIRYIPESNRPAKNDIPPIFTKNGEPEHPKENAASSL